MKNYRNAVAALALAFVISTPAFAGIMVTEKASPAPTPAVNGIIVAESTNPNMTINGIIHTDRAGSAPGAADAVTVIALNLLRSVLTLF